MKKTVVVMLGAGGLVLGLRKAGRLGFPEMHERAGEMCERMIEGMPESFPPKRLFANVEAIREQNERILELLEADRKG